MRTLSDHQLLGLWETGRSLHPIDQGLLALRAAYPETAHGDAADWPLGKRNRALAALRSAWFGPRLSGWAACPECGDKLEFELDARTLTGDGDGFSESRTVMVEAGGLR